MNKFKLLKDRDVWGIFCSGLCFIHCMTTIILLVGGLAWLGISSNGDEDDDTLLHIILITPITFLVLWHLPHSYSKHQNLRPICMGLVGLVGLSFALLLPISELWEAKSLTLVGSTLLIMAHSLNKRLYATH